MTRTKSYLLRPLVLLTFAAMVASVVAVVLVSPVQAADPLLVNSSVDTDDSACTTAAGGCTLREAINAANGSSGVADTINFNLVSPATITLGSQLPAITDGAGLVIDGGSANITVSGDNKYRVFEVGSSAKLTLNKLTVANGNAVEGSGGGIHNPSAGTVTVTNSTLSGNSATLAGGGIFNLGGTVTVTNSTLSGNSVSNGGGGGIFNNGPLTVSNSTLSGNSSSNGGGGGIFNNGGTLTLSNSTLSGNSTSPGDSGSILNNNTATIKNTIVSGGSCRIVLGTTPPGTFNDGGYNLDSGTSCGFSATNNSLSSTDPMLGPLAANGGPTLTHALLAGSPAIDKGVAVAGITTDQRGVTRPQGAAPDIGAFEVQSSAPDTKAPKVTNTTVPAADATRVAPGVNVTATFSEAMDAITTDGDPSTISSTTFKLMRAGTTTAIGAVVSYDSIANKATLNPNANLRLGTKYKAVVTTEAEDLAGNQLDQNSNQSGLQQKAWTFTTRN